MAERALAVLEAHWQPEHGYTAPNTRRYPFQWLWDSCFHAICWAALDRPDRAVAELRSVFHWQHASGFVPHVGYQADPDAHASFWGRRGASTITQPPMYGHAVAVLRRLGIDVPGELVRQAERGLAWIVEHRRRPGSGLVVVHPWETGCDDSPAWDGWGAGTPSRWFDVKGHLVRSLVLDEEGAAVGSTAFEVVSPGFTALVAFNAAELGLDLGADLSPVVPATLDDCLPALVVDRRDLLELALDDTCFGGPFGPAGVRRDLPAFDPWTYWRGPAWPQLTYLLWVAATRWGHRDLAGDLGRRLIRGAWRSGFAEYWHPDTGEGLGAVPQSWAALAAVVALSGGA